MAAPKIDIAPERIADGRRLYELTLTPVSDIAAMMGISRQTLARRIGEWGWIPRGAPRHRTDRALVAAALAAPTASAEVQAAAGHPVSAEARLALAARIQNSVERGLDAVDRVLGKMGPADEGGAERSARTLAAIARTLREIALFTEPDEVTPPDETDDDRIPLDMDELRRELTRRINAFVDARHNGESRAIGDAVAGIPGEKN
jgi:hypothetical protein